MTLGFDASTSTVGWCFSEDGKLIEAGFIDIKKFESSKEKSKTVISVIDSNPLIKSVEKIHLEAALSGFAGGFSSQCVIIKLSRFNAVFEYVISEHWKKPVILWNVNTVRKKVLGKSREKGVKSKDYVKAKLGILYDIHPFDIKNKRDDWDVRNSDMYDAMVLALA